MGISFEVQRWATDMVKYNSRIIDTTYRLRGLFIVSTMKEREEKWLL
jgi:hypothetical protein